MPELPEVETVRRVLEKTIIGQKIKKIDIFYQRLIENIDLEQFKKVLIGETFLEVRRKGKYLIFVLNNYYLLAHLRMEGKFFFLEDQEIAKHDHAVFQLCQGNLRYNDTRKFGRMYLFDRSLDIMTIKPLNKVGLEPFDREMTKDYLKKKFQKNNKAIKTTLLDQSVIAGLGNIYANEVLFMSKIHPLTQTSLLEDQQIEAIIANSIIVLNKAIKLGGTTIRSFQSSHAISGLFQNELLVHEQKKCPICEKTITKIFIGGRGTYFCDNCQKDENLDNFKKIL